ncbi:MAG: response regulator [Caulobacteraceae bacterium]
MKRVLVVDDTKNIRMLLTTCLEIEDYHVDTASNGREALKMLRTNEYDMVFLDIKLPEISGTEVLRNIRSAGNNTPVIIMTAFATVKNAVECTKLGAVHYLQKPFTADKVRAILNSLMIHQEAGNGGEGAASAERLIESGRFDEAYSMLKKSLSQNPEDGETYRMLGKLYEKQGDTEKAKKFYKVAGEFLNQE